MSASVQGEGRSASDINTLRTLIESALENASTFGDALRIQVMNNVEQVFHVPGIDASADVISRLKVRQETLVGETIRRNLGRSKATIGCLREALIKLNKLFPQEKE